MVDSCVGTFMRATTNPLVVFLRDGRGRVTAPLAHLLIRPLSAEFIAAYPRSGSTWMRTMLVNIINPNSESNPDVYNQIIPGVSLTRLWKVYRAPLPRILSTHSGYRPSIRRAVYILRDGRNAMLSMFRYMTARGELDMPLDKWIKLYMQGKFGQRWDQNVVSWLIKGREKLKEDLLVVRYEDCCADPHRELCKTCEFLGISYSLSDVNRAVELSSLEKSREWERKTDGVPKNEDASFYRGKDLDEWYNLLSEEQRNEFLSVSRYALRIGGYVIGDASPLSGKAEV